MVKVLIVEDEENFAQTLEFGLSDFGFEVKLASNGAEGLNVIETDRPDIIVTDISMPVMDGQEFLRRLRRIDPEMPVVVMTGLFSRLDEVIEADNYMEFIRKPFTDEDIIPILNRMTKKPE